MSRKGTISPHLTVYYDEDGRAEKIHSRFNPNMRRLDLGLVPRMSKEQVQRAAVYKHLDVRDIKGLELDMMGLVVYPIDWIDGELGWEVAVRNDVDSWYEEGVIIIRDADGGVVATIPEVVYYKHVMGWGA